MTLILPRVSAVLLMFVAGTALNAALYTPSLAVGYTLFALTFVAIAVGLWKFSDR